MRNLAVYSDWAVDKILNYVDRNYTYRDYSEIMKTSGLNGYVKKVIKGASVNGNDDIVPIITVAESVISSNNKEITDSDNIEIPMAHVAERNAFSKIFRRIKSLYSLLFFCIFIYSMLYLYLRGIMMNVEEKIDDILKELLEKGSEIEYLCELKEKSIELISKGLTFETSMDVIANDIKESTQIFLNSENEFNVNYVSGISCGIYLLDSKTKGEYKLKIISGNSSRSSESKIDENTLFDVASITKLFTLILLFKLEELGFLDLNSKIADINTDFKGLEDFSFNDLIRLHGEIRAIDNIKESKSKEEAYDMLKNLYLYSNDRTKNKYNDYGAIVIGLTIEKIVSRKLNKKMNFEEIMNYYVLKPLKLNNTIFNPKTTNVSGNGNKLGLVHDPMSRILGGVSGSAGIFTNSDDLMKLARALFDNNFINQYHLSKIGEVTFPENIQTSKGNLGVYVKNPLGYEKTFTPPEYSKDSFSSQGWTGSLATFDPNNFIHQSFLVNAIYESEDSKEIKNDKPVGYLDAFIRYQKEVTKKVMLMYVVKQYYNRYCSVKEEISKTKIIKHND